jgi:putative salt-induced outer membrane protein YdiY
MHTPLRFFIASVAGVLLAGLAHGAEPSLREPARGGDALPIPMVQKWQPQSPQTDTEWDWIQLTSGEWLKGELRSLERDVLDFDSDKLGILELDWEDVRQVMSAKPMAILYGNNNTAVGYLITEDKELVVLGTDVRLPLDQVISIAKGTPNERDLWTGDISLTLNLRTGNVEQQDFNPSVKLRRKTALSTFRFSYLGHYSYYDSVENANDHRATATYDYRIDRVWFFRPASVNYYRDPFQNIAHEWTVGAGLGLYAIDNKDVSWIFTAGPGYQLTRYANTLQGDKDTVDSPALFFSTQYEHELTDDVDLDGAYQVIFSDDESGRAKHHAELSLEVDLTDALDLKVAVYWDRVDKPKADESGVAPEPDDATLAIGLNLEL